MTKRQDLCLQRRSRPEQSDQRQPNQAANISHQPRASPNSTSLASRIEFPTMTGGQQESGHDVLDTGSVSLFVPEKPGQASGQWWPTELGFPNGTGAQNQTYL